MALLPAMRYKKLLAMIHEMPFIID